jgi:hypothetical protein
MTRAKQQRKHTSRFLKLTGRGKTKEFGNSEILARHDSSQAAKKTYFQVLKANRQRKNKRNRQVIAGKSRLMLEKSMLMLEKAC